MPPGYVRAVVPEKTDFDRNAFYEQYVTNVLPSNFTIKRVGDKIIIQVKDD